MIEYNCCAAIVSLRVQSSGAEALDGSFDFLDGVGLRHGAGVAAELFASSLEHLLGFFDTDVGSEGSFVGQDGHFVGADFGESSADVDVAGLVVGFVFQQPGFKRGDEGDVASLDTEVAFGTRRDHGRYELLDHGLVGRHHG